MDGDRQSGPGWRHQRLIPLHGQYGRFQILNWAVKFFVDSMLLKPPLPQVGTNPEHFARNPGFRQAIMLICA